MGGGRQIRADLQGEESPRLRAEGGGDFEHDGNVFALAGHVQEMMVEAVENGGVSGAKSSLVQIGAKTGTAQIGGTDNVHSWITGFAPAEDPQYAVTIVIEDTDLSTGHRLTVDNMKRIMEAVVAE